MALVGDAVWSEGRESGTPIAKVTAAPSVFSVRSNNTTEILGQSIRFAPWRDIRNNIIRRLSKFSWIDHFEIICRMQGNGAGLLG